jgi:hypothetical protein
MIIMVINNMKVVKDTLKGILLTIWIVIAIASTICLLFLNEHRVSEFGDTSMFVVDNKSISKYGFNKYDMVFVSKQPEDTYKKGDLVFFYYNNRDIGSYVNLAEITSIDVLKNTQDNYYFGDVVVSYGNIIGAANGAMKLGGIGFIYNIISSRWGFLFLIILPTIYLVVYEIYRIVVVVKREYQKEMKNMQSEGKKKDPEDKPILEEEKEKPLFVSSEE